MSATRAGLYNMCLATAAGAAAAFAAFAMPDQLMQQELESWGILVLLDGPVRAGAVAIVGLFAFLLAYLSLRACDRRPHARKFIVAEEPIFDLDEIFTPEAGVRGPAVPADDPFLALARGAEPIEETLELQSTQEMPAEREDRHSPASRDAVEVTDLPTRQFPDRADAGSPSEESFQGMMQRLNAGVAGHEWPIRPEPTEEDAEVRLRDVLQNLKQRAQNG